jgi:hypothetical protein
LDINLTIPSTSPSGAAYFDAGNCALLFDGTASDGNAARIAFIDGFTLDAEISPAAATPEPRGEIMAVVAAMVGVLYRTRKRRLRTTV